MRVVFRAGMLTAIGFTDGKLYKANQVSDTGAVLRVTNDNGHERFVLIGHPCAHVDWYSSIMPESNERVWPGRTPTPTVLLCGTFELAEMAGVVVYLPLKSTVHVSEI